MLEIIYQDEWLVAVNKPSGGWFIAAGWTAMKSGGDANRTRPDWSARFTAHRLDRPTSGVLLMGLSSEAGRRLSQQFEQHQMQSATTRWCAVS